MEKQLAIGVLFVASAFGLGAALSPARKPEAPPEVEAGKTLMVDWKGGGLSKGEILQVDGAWVKIRFTSTTTLEGDKAISTVGDAWVNFERLAYYMAPRPAK